MIVLPVPENYIPKTGSCNCCILILNLLLIALVVFYILALVVDTDAQEFSCSTSNDMDYAWNLSLASTVGRIFVTLRIIILGLMSKERKKETNGVCEILYCVFFIAETLPGLLLFHLLLTSPQECLDEFMADYDLLGNAITIQGYACFILV